MNPLFPLYEEVEDFFYNELKDGKLNITLEDNNDVTLDNYQGSFFYVCRDGNGYYGSYSKPKISQNIGDFSDLYELLEELKKYM